MEKEFEWRTGRSCVFKNYLHLVFVTKYRRGVFTKPMLERLRELFDETCNQMDVELIEFGGEDDHAHLMVCCPPKLAVSNLVGKLKGKSSYFLRQEYWPQIEGKLWGGHLWSPSYCLVSCGGAPLETVRKYVAEQREPPDPKAVRKSLDLQARSEGSEKVRSPSLFAQDHVCSLDSALKNRDCTSILFKLV